MPRPANPLPHTRISATYASQLLLIDKATLDVAIDIGECLSYESNSDNRYTCLQWVGEWQTREAERRAAALRGPDRFDRYSDYTTRNRRAS